MAGKSLFRWIMVAALGFVLSTGSVAQPKLVLEKQDYDLGTVYNGAILKTRLKIVNGGKSELQIKSVRTSCGCTTVKEPKDQIAPGDSDFIEVQFNSTGFRGTIVKYVNIESNDPTNQFATIKLTTDVKEILQPTNNFSLVWFGDVPVGKEMHLPYILRNISNGKISIKGIKKVYEKLAVSYDKRVIAPQDSVVLTVTVVPNRIGFFNETLTLETDSKNQPHVPVRVSYVGVKPL